MDDNDFLQIVLSFELDKEEWKLVPMAEGYELSSEGRLRNRNNRILKNVSNLYFNFTIGGVIRRCRKAELVASLFLEKPRNASFLAHLDGNEKNVHANNLCWIDHRHVYQFSPEGYLIKDWTSSLEIIREKNFDVTDFLHSIESGEEYCGFVWRYSASRGRKICIWKNCSIEDFEFSISDVGFIKVMCGIIYNPGEYLFVHGKKYLVGELVIRQFCDVKDFVNIAVSHKDKNPSNNEISNLNYLIY